MSEAVRQRPARLPTRKSVLIWWSPARLINRLAGVRRPR